MSRCPYCAAETLAAVSYSDGQFHMCRECGVVFKTVAANKHASLAATIYSLISWGHDRQESIRAHGPIIRNTLLACHALRPLSIDQTYLDIGAGVGVLEHVLFDIFGTKDVKMTPLEPVPEIAQCLRLEYPSLHVVNASIEDFRPTEQFDVVFCLGVDYLFNDLNASLARISKLGRLRWVFSRAVFLDMPSYFGGKRIDTFADLVSPNPLISTFMYADQYLEMLTRHFSVSAHRTFEVAYPREPGKNATTRFFIADCGPSTEKPPQPVRNPERALRRLTELSVSVAMRG